VHGSKRKKKAVGKKKKAAGKHKSKSVDAVAVVHGGSGDAALFDSPSKGTDKATAGAVASVTPSKDADKVHCYTHCYTHLQYILHPHSILRLNGGYVYRPTVHRTGQLL